MLYFFLSYAPGDDDSYVAKFYSDLSREVKLLTPAGTHEVGFMDTRAGVDSPRWSDAVNKAISTCRVFVPLYSPGYFLSERCGREWAVFTERLRRQQRIAGTAVRSLLPVIWAGTGLPGGPDPSIEAAVPDPVARDGVRQMIRLRSLRESYRAFVSSLARRLVTTAHESAPPPIEPPADVAVAVNAFELRGHPAAGDEPLASRWRTEVVAGQVVHFVIAAGTRDEMGTVREDVEFYGDSRVDWAPYRPAGSAPVADHARAVAAQRLFGAEVADVYGLRERIDRAHRNNEIVVLIVDSWAIKLEPYRRTLAEFDRRGGPTVAILAPASADDAETALHRAELREGLLTTLQNNTARHDRMFRSEIESGSRFDNALVGVLEEARNRIFRTGRVFRQPATEQPVGRPILDGP